jgi:hypothetical protein
VLNFNAAFEDYVNDEEARADGNDDDNTDDDSSQASSSADDEEPTEDDPHHVDGESSESSESSDEEEGVARLTAKQKGKQQRLESSDEDDEKQKATKKKRVMNPNYVPTGNRKRKGQQNVVTKNGAGNYSHGIVPVQVVKEVEAKVLYVYLFFAQTRQSNVEKEAKLRKNKTRWRQLRATANTRQYPE